LIPSILSGNAKTIRAHLAAQKALDLPFAVFHLEHPPGTILPPERIRIVQRLRRTRPDAHVAAVTKCIIGFFIRNQIGIGKDGAEPKKSAVFRIYEQIVSAYDAEAR